MLAVSLRARWDPTLVIVMQKVLIGILFRTLLCNYSKQQLDDIFMVELIKFNILSTKKHCTYMNNHLRMSFIPGYLYLAWQIILQVIQNIIIVYRCL